MTIDDLIIKLNALDREISKLNLSTDNLLRILPHFRLDWGSNDGELTMDYNIGATKPILITGLAGAEHKIKNNNIFYKNNKISELLVDTFIYQKKLTKDLLLQIHSFIIKDGGEWRTQEVIVNDATHVLNSTFTDNQDIINQIDGLVKWYNKEVELNDMNPVLLCTMFHYNLVKIHPFIDGNGRLARIIASLILLSNGMPPPVFLPEDRSEYIICLRKADLDDIKPLLFFIGNRVINSMEYILSIKK